MKVDLLAPGHAGWQMTTAVLWNGAADLARHIFCHFQLGYNFPNALGGTLISLRGELAPLVIFPNSYVLRGVLENLPMKVSLNRPNRRFEFFLLLSTNFTRLLLIFLD